MHPMRRTVVAALLLAAVLAGCRTAGGDGAGGGGAVATVVPPNATVVRVVDGDTVVVRVGGREERVRLIGIDTPESVREGTPVECWAEEASRATKGLLPPGTPVRLERDAEARDRFDRLLAYVVRAEDAVVVNEELARIGAADALVIEPNVARTGEIGRAVASARAAGIGLWGACGGAHEPLPPAGS